MAINEAAVNAPVRVPGHARAVILMIGSSVMMSFGGLIIRNMQEADSWQVNLHRAYAAFLGVLIILLLRYGRTTLRQVRGIGRSGVLGGGLLGMAGVCFLQAITTTTVANTLFILSAIPFFSALLARLILGERLRRVTLFAMSAAACGIVVMVSAGLSAGAGYGNAMALATAFLFAAYAVIVRRKRHVDMYPVLLVATVCVFVVAGSVRFGDWAIPWHDVALCFLWGGVLSGIANWMFIVASRNLVAAELTLFMLLEFSLGPIWVWLFVAESPSRETIIGGSIVIVAVAVWALLQMRGRIVSGRPPADVL
ncbi:MAG: DMT family transporter [Gammaproteobacteria bacterium]|nr:DMT family transporter [Gammaproteobacteria bacterium]